MIDRRCTTGLEVASTHPLLGFKKHYMCICGCWSGSDESGSGSGSGLGRRQG
jgi:hypothetical protein